jgi:hypothetical protein
MDSITKLISDLRVIQDRGILLTMDGIITILENIEENSDSPELADILMDFLLYLNNKELINNHDFDYEYEINKFLKK